MKKFTTIAATLAMVLVAAVPAHAQTTVDNSEFEFDANVEESFNGNNVAINDSDIVQNGGDQRNINGDGNVNINEQEAEQDSEANAGDVEYVNYENDGDNDNDGVNDEDEDNRFYYEDEDFDGIADIFDFFVLFGDFDNDGVNDEFENGFEGSSVVIAQ